MGPDAEVITRRQRQRAATVDEINDVARSLLRGCGPSGVTMRGIAREMGMTPAALYRYFPTVDELLAGLLAGVVDEIRAVVEAAAGPLARLTALRGWATAHPREFAVVFTHAADASTRAALDRLAAAVGAGLPPADGALCWVRVSGLVLLEVLGHIDDGDVLFAAELDAAGRGASRGV